MQCRQLLSLWKIVSDKQSIMRPLSIGRTKEQRCFEVLRKLQRATKVDWCALKVQCVCTSSSLALWWQWPHHLDAKAHARKNIDERKKETCFSAWSQLRVPSTITMIFFSPHHCRSLSLSHFPSSVSSSFFSAFLFSLSLLLPLFSLVLSSWPFGFLSYHRSHPRADTKKSEAYFIPKIKKRQKDEVSSCPPPGAAPTTLLPLCIFIGCEDCGRKNRFFFCG